MIKQVHSHLLNKSVSVETILENCQKRVNSIKDLNAFVRLTPIASEQAITSSKNFQEGRPRSALEGVPIAVKDNFCVKNVETTCASKMLQHFKPSYSATVVDKLFSSGSVLLGRTNLDEFAMGSGTVNSIHGPTKNIWGQTGKDDDWYICGGSSGGSAVAVASGACFGALGSDTGGSTRNPAAFCGVVGLKPTYGSVSRYGLIPLVNSMDVPGILAPTVEDAALLLDCISGYDFKDSTTVREPTLINSGSEASVKKLKIGIPAEYYCEGLSNEVLETWKEIGKMLEEGGSSVASVSMPHTKYSIVCYSVLNQCEVASNMAKYDGIKFGHRADVSESADRMFAETRAQGFNNIVKSRILSGNYFLLRNNYEKYFNKALKVRRLISNDFKNAWREGIDLLLTPTTLSEAPLYSEYINKSEREQNSVQDYFTQPANMSGCPAISIPVKLSKNGLPLGLQLMAPNFKDNILLQVAQYIEKAVQFPGYSPREFSKWLSSS